VRSGFQVVVLKDGVPKDVFRVAKIITGAVQGLVEGEVLMALKQGGGMVDLRFDLFRVRSAMLALERNGVVAKVVEIEDTHAVPASRVVNEVQVSAEGLAFAGGALAWKDVVAVSAANVKTTPMHLETPTPVLDDVIGEVLDGEDGFERGAVLAAKREELAEARESSSKPEPFLDLISGRELTWVRLPLERLRFTGPGIATTFRANFAALLRHLKAGTASALRAGDAVKLEKGLEPARLPMVEAYLYLRFIRWLKLRNALWPD
jgi:hypothetical protein